MKAPTRPALAIEATGRSVTTIKLTVDSTATWEQWFLLSSDRHHDNPKCDQALEKRHLDQALERNALVIDAGDLFCAMQGKYDKRSNKSAVRPEHQCGDYLDALVRTGADFFEPYANNIAVIGRGNHETKIRERHETDLTERLVATLNDRVGTSIVAGGYTHWVRLQITRATERLSRIIWWTHGYGGGGPVTQDMIQGQRQRAYIENADIMMSGHTHDAWCMDAVRLKLNKAGIVERRSVYQLKLPTYKDAYSDGHDAWEVERGMPPKPLGAYWARFWWDGNRGLQTEITRAT